MTSSASGEPLSTDGPDSSGKRHTEHDDEIWDRQQRSATTAGSPSRPTTPTRPTPPKTTTLRYPSLETSGNYNNNHPVKSPVSHHRLPPALVVPYMYGPSSSDRASQQSYSRSVTGSPSTSSLRRLGGNRDPSVPPPQRPPPPHIPGQTTSSPPSPLQSQPSASQAPLIADHLNASPTGSENLGILSPPPSRGLDSVHQRQQHPQHPQSLLLPSAQTQSSSTRGLHRIRGYSPASSRASVFSTSPVQRQASRSQSHSDESDDDNESVHADADATSQATPAGSSSGSGPALQRPKRTRVLMTHIQQQRLGSLWKRAKFPTTQEREEIAVEVGLTPRQVQVWFQNRRQTFRKQIQQNSVPHGSDPADYSDLQKSPRSRRLSLEAANAVMMEGRERVSAWANSSGSAGSYPPRMYNSLGEILDRPATAQNPPLYSLSRSPPSPRRLYDSDYGHGHAHSHWRGQGIYRPATAAPNPTSSSLHSSGSMSSPDPQHHGPFAHYPSPLRERRRGSLWDYRTFYTHPPQTPTAALAPAPAIVRSPGPHSPPTTAETAHHPRFPSYSSDTLSDGSNKRPRVHDPEPARDVHVHVYGAGGAGGNSRVSPERRLSHLPPSLAAIAISRPLDRGGTPRTEISLPSLSASLDSARGPPPPPSPRRTASPWRPHEVRVSNDYNDPVDAQRHSPRSAVIIHSPTIPDLQHPHYPAQRHPQHPHQQHHHHHEPKLPIAVGVSTDHPRDVVVSHAQKQLDDGVPSRPPPSASNLPRFNELFR